MILNIVIVILGVILYCISPNTYNFPICCICLAGFLLTSWDLLREDFKNRNYINFNTFFLISFFLTSFCFPVFVMNSDSMFTALSYASMAVFRHVNFDWVTKATCLCLASVNLYAIGFKYFQKHDASITSRLDNRSLNASGARVLLVISALLVIGNVVLTLSSRDFKGFVTNNYFYEIYDALLALSFVARWDRSNKESGVMPFIKNNVWEIGLSAVICFMLMSFNERGMALSIIMIVLASYSLYRKINGVTLIVLMLVGSLSMYVIRLAKMENVNFTDTSIGTLTQDNGAEDSPLLIFSDLLGAEMELCVSYEIKETQGLQKPEQIVLIPFMPFPLLPSFASQLFFNTTYDDARAAQALNIYMSDYGATFGKHCVGDVYMRWGIVGIFVFFLVFGYFVGKFCTLKDRNLYYLASFFILLSLSIYIPRSSLIDIIRPLFYIYIFSLLLSNKNTVTY